jgi:nucleoside-diphosphate-sugar epimerase
MNQAVIVTGASGLIGLRLVTALAKQGWSICALTSRPELLDNIRDVHVIRYDWTEANADRALAEIEEFPYMVHCAARLHGSMGNGLQFYKDNCLLTQRLVRRFLSLSNAIRFVYFSSISVYGPQNELSIQTIPKPETHYAMSKLIGEFLCTDSLGDRCTIIRLPGVWGLEESPELFVNRCLRRAAEGMPLRLDGTGYGRRNYIWVGDIPDIIASVFEKNISGTHLVSGSECLSINEMLSAMSETFKIPLLSTPDDFRDKEVDILVEATLSFSTTPFNIALALELEELK